MEKMAWDVSRTFTKENNLMTTKSLKNALCLVSNKSNGNQNHNEYRYRPTSTAKNWRLTLPGVKKDVE